MGQIWSWVQAQPDPVRAGIYAAGVAVLAIVVNNVVALIGLAITNAVTLRKTRAELQHDRDRTAKQLEHDRALAEAQRKLDLRRDTYMGLAEHILAGINTITAWGDFGLQFAQIVEDRKRAAKYSAQIHLMAQPPLVDAVSRCNQAIDAAIIRVRVKREAVAVQEHKMKQLRKRIDAHRAQAEAAVARIRTKGLDGPLPNDVFQHLQNIAEKENNQAHQLAIEHDDILLKVLPEMRCNLFADALDETKEIYPLVKHVIAAARAELGEQIDMSVYDEVLAHASDTDRGQLRKLFGLPEQPDPAARNGG
jgi:hypothetical protein